MLGLSRSRSARWALAGLLLGIWCLAAGCRTEPKKSAPQESLSAPCSAWFGCGQWGLCTARDGVCVAATHSSCERSKLCGTHGMCRAQAGVCRPVPKAGSCDGLGTTGYDACTQSGNCQIVAQMCSPGVRADTDCRRVRAPDGESSCKGSGMCVAKGGWCVATRQHDCEVSVGCRLSGLCRLAAERCVGTPSSCAASATCMESGECKEEFGVCVATASTCAATAMCRDQKKGCEVQSGRCILPETPFIYFQF